MIVCSNPDLRKMRIDQIAKNLAWDDLDKDDHRVYLREAEKLYNKQLKEYEDIVQIPETMKDPNYVSRADSSAYLPKKSKKRR